MYAARLGVDRAAAMNPLASLSRAGVRLALGSDSPVTPFDPWGAVRACTTHHVPRHRLDAATAFTAHTVGGWRAAGVEGVGRLAPGAPATFAAWDVDESPTCSLPALDDAHRPPRCLLTVSRGRVLYDGR
jgi:predicted amidohydrolase YtcJ